MLRAESRTVGKFLASAAARTGNPVIMNIGSSTARYREFAQPYIDKNVFSHFEDSATIIHVDAKREPGVDVVADITSRNAVAELRTWNANIFVLSNLLEHVSSPGLVAENLGKLAQPGDFLVLSGPKFFPFHPDPIDNMFRPQRSEVENLFAEFSILDWTTVAHLTMAGSTVPSIGGLAPRLVRILAHSGRRFFSERVWRQLLPVTAWCASAQRK